MYTRMRDFHWLFLVFGTVACVTTVSSRGLADEPREVETNTQGDGYGYKFKDDSLLGSTLATGGDIYKIRKGFQRVLLVRPRTNFIPEVFKSVENM